MWLRYSKKESCKKQTFWMLKKGECPIKLMFSSHIVYGTKLTESQLGKTYKFPFRDQ